MHKLKNYTYIYHIILYGIEKKYDNSQCEKCEKKMVY